MTRASEPRVRAVVAAFSLCILTAPSAGFAQRTIDLASVFEAPEEQPLTASQILERAFDNLYGFDASISALSRQVPSGRVESEFRLLRKNIQGAVRQMVVSLQPREVRGTRVLELLFEDGREQTYAFVPSVSRAPMPTQFRLAEPFLGTWHEITEEDSSLRELSSVAACEILGLAQTTAQGEPVYLLTIRPLIDRGYAREELWIARSDFAILEKRQYLANRRDPTLIYRAPREQMRNVEGRSVPGQVLYTVSGEGDFVVELQHQPLPPGEDGFFFPRGFHLIPISGL